MDYQIGGAVGSLARFMHIPKDRQEQFTIGIAKSWRFKGSEKSQPNDFYLSYLSGVFDEEARFNGLVVRDVDDESIDTDDQDEDENNEPTDDWRGTRQPDGSHRAPQASEQDLIDAQLQRELSWSLCPNQSSDVAIASTTDDDVCSVDPDVPLPVRIAGVPDLDCPPGSRYAQPRSSSLFTFERPKIPGRPTNWETMSSGEITPAPTERSIWDDFTTELLAKAEECSTMGSFGRGPSTNRALSELVQVDNDEREEKGYGKDSGRSMDGEDPIIVDFSLDDNDDDDDDDDVVDLGLEIIGSRAIRAQG